LSASTCFDVLWRSSRAGRADMDDRKCFDQSTPNLERAREKERASLGWVVSASASMRWNKRRFAKRKRARDSESERESKRQRGVETEGQRRRERSDVLRDSLVRVGAGAREGGRAGTRASARQRQCASMPRERPVGVCPPKKNNSECGLIGRVKRNTLWHSEPSHAQCKSDRFLLTVAGGQLAPSVVHFKAVLAVVWPEMHCVTALRGSVRSLRSEFSNTRLAGTGTPVPSFLCS